LSLAATPEEEDSSLSVQPVEGSADGFFVELEEHHQA